MTKKHSHYFKDVSKFTTVDVYRVLKMYSVTDPCIAHAVKKLLVPGGRGGGKTQVQDVQEAIDTLTRFIEMNNEEGIKPLSGATINLSPLPGPPVKSPWVNDAFATAPSMLQNYE